MDKLSPTKRPGMILDNNVAGPSKINIDEHLSRTNNTADDEEIPAITFHKLFSSSLKPSNLFKAYILQLINSQLVQQDPFEYKFGDVRYSYVKISGRVISRKYHLSESITFIVGDETGSIKCIAFPNERLKRAQELASEYSEKENRHTVEDETMKQAEDMIMEKCVNRLYEFTKRSDISLGDKVTIIGQLKEKDERLIIIWNIHRLQGVRDYAQKDKKRRPI